MATKEAIRGGVDFESLGAPVKRLLAKLKGNVSEEDMALLTFVSVKDMARIFDSLNTDRTAEDIWEELRAALMARKDKQLSKQRELSEREKALLAMKDEEAADEAEEERLRAEAEERKRRKAEKKARKQAEAEAAAEEEERLRLEAEAEEADRLEAERQEEEEARAAERRRKKEEKKRKLREEEERLAKQKAEADNSKRDQRKDWEDFVASHPLEYSDSAGQEIQQKSKNDNADGLAPRPTLAASADLLNRTWTPYCPHCHAKYSKPPPEWDCSMCLRKFRQHVKCWQPDDKAPNCAICKRGVGRFTRHHCRNCGRIVCGPCSDYSAKITSVGYTAPVRVCRQCVDELGTVQQAGQ